MDMKKLNEGATPCRGKKRVGRGVGNGHGKTCGRGDKGQKARTGYSRRPTFEGGRLATIRKLPKRGFKNARFALETAVVNVGDLNVFEPGSTVDPGALAGAGLFRGRPDRVKILGAGELTVKLEVKAHAFSKSAVEKIEGAKGTVLVI